MLLDIIVNIVDSS